MREPTISLRFGCEPHRVPHERRVGHLPRHAIGERGRRHPPGLRAHHLPPAVGPAVLVQVLRQLGRFAAPGLTHEHDHAARLEGVQDPGAVGEDGECPTLGGVVAVDDVDGGGGGGSSGGRGAAARRVLGVRVPPSRGGGGWRLPEPSRRRHIMAAAAVGSLYSNPKAFTKKLYFSSMPLGLSIFYVYLAQT